MHPFNNCLVQELNENELDRRFEFSENIMNRIDLDPNFLKRIIFSDEVTFFVKHDVIRHSYRFWSRSNTLDCR